VSVDLVLNDRYRLTERLATGGMGEVWRAVDEVLDREVAVKLLRQEYVSDAVARTRFQAEARFAARLQHGGIAQVYDYGEQDDRVFLVMELVPGEPLSRILRRAGKLTPEAALDLVSQAARALHVAHQAGIVHRDVKPANIMITAEGTVKITDFGIARATEASSVTGTGMVMGTAQYVSPEQASGQEISPASDLYSLGVVTHECLTGVPPFQADTPVAVALKHVREAPPELGPQIPAPVRELVGQLLAKDPQDRPAGAQAVADRAFVIRESLVLGTALAENEVTQGFPGPIDEPSRRSTLFYSSIAAGILLLGVIVVGSLWRLPQHSTGLNGNTVVSPSHSGPAPTPLAKQDVTDSPSAARTSSRPVTSYSVTTSPSPKTSTTGKVSTTPTISTRPVTPSPSTHSPTPTTSTTTPSSPSSSPPSTSN